MAKNTPLSLKTFHEELERRLGTLSADDLRGLIRLQARAQSPEQRRSFLDHLQPSQALNAGLENELRSDALLQEIADLGKELRKAMEEPPEPEYGHSWDDRYDDEDDGSRAYERAATLVVAAAELLKAASGPAAAAALLDNLRQRHNRKSAFKKELLSHRQSAGL